MECVERQRLISTHDYMLLFDPAQQKLPFPFASKLAEMDFQADSKSTAGDPVSQDVHTDLTNLTVTSLLAMENDLAAQGAVEVEMDETGLWWPIHSQINRKFNFCQ